MVVYSQPQIANLTDIRPAARIRMDEANMVNNGAYDQLQNLVKKHRATVKATKGTNPPAAVKRILKQDAKLLADMAKQVGEDCLHQYLHALGATSDSPYNLQDHDHGV